jgi:allene oxide cyclase
MRRAAFMALTLAIAIAVAAAVAAGARGGHGVHGGKGHHGNGHGGRALVVTEHATTDATTDTGAAGDSAGDVLTFANDVFDAADANKVGTDQGYCIRVVPGTSYECNWTTSLAGGQITVEGPFLDAGDSVLAVTGGTGRYSTARGFMKLHALDNGAKYTFEFHLKG